MKLKIQKEGKIKSYNLINSWSDVNLERWAELIKIKTDKNSEDALETLTVLSDMPKKVIRELSLEDVSKILKKVSEMQSLADTKLVRIIEIEGKEYGFHPNLDDITLGEYADIETLLKEDVSDVLPEIMSILYRPIVEKTENGYTIEKYNGNIAVRKELMKNLTGEQVQSALVFFWTLGVEFFRSIQLCLMELSREAMKGVREMISEKSGDGSE
tara:strand:- start:17 stop:658 length:642 start_codon:yes stop_codon:yes gene_type:complete